MQNTLTAIKSNPNAGATATQSLTLLRLLERAAGQALPETEAVEAVTERIVVRKGEALFHVGEPHGFIYGLRSGLVKFCYSDAQGREWIKSFIETGGYIGSMSALSPGGVASFSAVALADCALERVPFRVVERLAREHLPWSQALLRMVMLLAAKKEQREHELLTLDAAQRYAHIVQESPAWLSAVSQKDLALYLGVTPVGLNRIVARARAGE
jgi:CRP-like cAMP-binding protein